MTPTEKLTKLVAWADSEKPPSQCAKPALNQITQLVDRILYADRMLAKHAGIKDSPCMLAARSFDPKLRAGEEYNGHWVLEPDATYRLIDETWGVVVNELKRVAEERLRKEAEKQDGNILEPVG